MKICFITYQGEKQGDEDQVAKDHEFAMKLHLQMFEDNHRNEVQAGKLSDAFKDSENEADRSDEFPDDAFESENVFDNIRKQGGLQRFIRDKGGEPSCSVLPPRADFSPINISISSLSDDDSPDEREKVDESSIKVTPPPSFPSPKRRKADPNVKKKKSLKELFESVRELQLI